MRFFLVTTAIFLALSSLSLHAFNSERGYNKGSDSNQDLDSLVLWLQGSFSNEYQARKDTSYRNLRVHVVRIWKPAKDGIWFYVEADEIKGDTASVIQQEIYRLILVEEGMFELAPFRIKQADRITYQDTISINALAKDKLQQQRGCEIYLQAADTKFFGNTHGTACECTNPKGSYSITDFSISDRGFLWLLHDFASNGKALSGQKTVPYGFLKQ